MEEDEDEGVFQLTDTMLSPKIIEYLNTILSTLWSCWSGESVWVGPVLHKFRITFDLSTSRHLPIQARKRMDGLQSGMHNYSAN